MPRINSLSELEELRKDILSNRDPQKPCITLCSGSACLATGSGQVAASIEAEIEKQGLSGAVDVRKTGCHGFCERGPIIVNHPEESCHFQITPEDVPEILSRTIKEKKVVERLLYTDPDTDEKITCESEIPFYKNQKRLVFGSNGSIDPKRIDDYLAIGGYSALAKVLSGMTAEQVLEEVKKSNLRGRGGGGFPAGRKWEESRNAPGDIKYVIVNADEGDPGAYMDRSLLEGNPHSVLEGLMIGAYAIGSKEGYVYVRQEYPLAVENLAIAIRQAEEYGFIGENILDSGFDFKVIVHKGAGAFVCGESSALMTALEGRTGEPRPKYIHTAVKGVWDNPSVLNNVETWANVPMIINKGAAWFTQIGTEKSKGTKIFSLVGKITNTGLVEVPMGMTLRNIIFEIGGGIPGGKKFKAVQTGGPSGGCIPENLLDLEVGFDELTRAGSMMGSGGMIVMDEDTCMVDVARYFIDFLTDESCGKCVPCREGLRQMLKILTNITEGNGKKGDIELLEELSEVAIEASLCALGTSAPNPFLSTVRYFRDEYEAHIEEKRCPALSCKELIAYHIDPTKCRACMICARKCPVDAVLGGKRKIHIIDQEKCTRCGTCFEVCPARFDAVEKISGVPVPPPIPEEQRIIPGKGKE
ncbi:MAG: NADH-ubiquinone oxidoreductase-F iron-sulfur binding region domain-containing protein [Desulfobacterales bacterium]|nr:NADH-ubiquinone oxidoreductase-F iron-sulfur binding region domain-containing protein [Desulfobacterales bacterium]